MSKFTPGPWFRGQTDTSSKYGVFAGHPVRVICYTAGNAAQRTCENEANARLIAAAPELLAALIGLIERAQVDMPLPMQVREIVRARAAVAKATGSAVEEVRQ